MSVCAVIVSYRTGDALKACLASLLAAANLDQIVIADNGNDASAEALLDEVAERDARVRIVRGQGNIGFAAACNLAAREAKAETLAFINPDVILELDAITRLEAALAASPPAIVGGDLRDEQGNNGPASMALRMAAVLEQRLEADGLRLSIKDNGVGFDVDRAVERREFYREAGRTGRDGDRGEKNHIPLSSPPSPPPCCSSRS